MHGSQTDLYNNKTADEYVINLPYIPFVCGELENSLLSDVANHQIALLNLESRDITFCLQANRPFYVENQNMNTQPWGRTSAEGEAEPSATDGDAEMELSETQGRRYAHGLQPPEFIHPSPEPLQVSMEKQRQLKEDIRRLVHLALSTVSPKMASAESKSKDAQGLEAGLSHVGTVLEHMENRIAAIWADYEGAKQPAQVLYPKTYSLQTEEDRQEEAKVMEELRDVVPSGKFQKFISRAIVKTLIGHKASLEEIDAINKEIEEAKSYSAKEEFLIERLKEGAMDRRLFAEITGMPESTIDAAEQEHADRLARVVESQTAAAAQNNPAARGNPDASGNPTQDAAAEKAASRQTDKKDSTKSRVRGEGK
jgi:hypothetical protein